MPDGPAAPVSSSDGDLALVQPINDQGKLTLRAKQIQAVGFNEPKREVTVFLKRAVPSKKALGQLPTKVADVSVRYRQGASVPIGP